MIKNKFFRQAKYQNFSGNKQGSWFMNTLDYFEFYHFPEYKKLYLWCTFGLLFGILGLKYLTIYLAPLAAYLIYVTTITATILYTQKCKYRGYFLYPKKSIHFFKNYKKELPLLSFDNLATLGEKNSHAVNTLNSRY